eukprot:10248525-Alexandrium_andersonii.AAC.1
MCAGALRGHTAHKRSKWGTHLQLVSETTIREASNEVLFGVCGPTASEAVCFSASPANDDTYMSLQTRDEVRETRGVINVLDISMCGWS